ncbi:hypothetical protein BD560DRAFT_414300 [Blakeslea trispora]|nr:hypothetical protein BD560DRAFT_414300 [Blakeslea trispora]
MKRSRTSRAEASSNWRSSSFSLNNLSDPSREIGNEHVVRRQRTLDMWLNTSQTNINHTGHLSQSSNMDTYNDPINRNVLAVKNEQSSLNEIPTFSFVPENNTNNSNNQAFSTSNAPASWNPFNSRTIDPFKSLVQTNTDAADFMEIESSTWNSTRQSSLPTNIQIGNPPPPPNPTQIFGNTMSMETQENRSVSRPYNVIKITHFPFHVGINDIKSLFSGHPHFSLPAETDLVQCVHIMMDTKTGKTKGIAFVEVICQDQSNMAKHLANFSFRNHQVFRSCKFMLSSYDEICSQLFYNWNGQFHHGLAYPNNSSNIRDMMMAGSKKTTFFIHPEELRALINICQKFKANFNRRCPDRPFEYFISLILHMPWKQQNVLNAVQPSLIYQHYKHAAITLYQHTSKNMHAFEPDILVRFIQAGLSCPGFTMEQKAEILSSV